MNVFRPAGALRAGYASPGGKYRMHICPMVSVTQGKIGYVFARDGRDLPAGQTLAENAHVADFRDVRAFLAGGGQKGPQRKVLREGTHIINPALFVVMTEEATYSMPLEEQERAYYDKMREVLDRRRAFKPVVIRSANDAPESDLLAVVTVRDGPPLARDDLQERVLVEGTYDINRLFATAELIKKTVIPVGFVGVVVSYTRRWRKDLSGTEC